MDSGIKILADKDIMLEQHHLPETVSLTRYNPEKGIPSDAGSYDALFVRTVSPVGKHTIPNNPERISFVGSATAGINHIDHEWLEQNGIRFAHSPGCNANSVGEYVATALIIWSLKTNTDLSNLTFGIIGAGNTGTAVGNLLKKLQVKHHFYDPPREEREPEFKSVDMADIIDCDILSFHTPLIMDGQWPTRYWLDLNKLINRKFKLIINTARGGVIDEIELYRAYRRRDIGSYILDVWENEPLYNDRIAYRALIRTPHIAGYSLQSKCQATSMILDAFNNHFGLEPAQHALQDDLPSPPEIPDEESGSCPLNLLCRLHPIGIYKKEFDATMGLRAVDKSRRFQEIRTGQPLRHEFPHIKLGHQTHQQFPFLSSLGFDSK